MRVTFIATYLDSRPIFSYYDSIFAPLRELVRRHAGPSGEGGARERSCNPFPGGLGISLPALGPAREVLAVTGAGAGRSEARHFRRLSREAWPKAEPLGCVSPSGKSRGGTPEGVRALQGARRNASCGGGALRLTAFRFLFLSFAFVAFGPDRDEAGRHRRIYQAKIGF
jgi:hypothetical protein